MRFFDPLSCPYPRPHPQVPHAQDQAAHKISCIYQYATNSLTSTLMLSTTNNKSSFSVERSWMIDEPGGFRNICCWEWWHWYHGAPSSDWRHHTLTALISVKLLTSPHSFSSNSYFADITPWERGTPYLRESLRCFNERADVISTSAIQACVLISFVCLVENQLEQEALLIAQAVRMVQFLRIPRRETEDPACRELDIRCTWYLSNHPPWSSPKLSCCSVLAGPDDGYVEFESVEESAPTRCSLSNTHAVGRRPVRKPDRCHRATRSPSWTRSAVLEHLGSNHRDQ